MTSKCVKCGLVWQISPLKKIGKEGYVCPHCEFVQAKKKSEKGKLKEK